MTKQLITQSEKRFLESLGSNFSHSTLENADYIFIKSSSDIGVERNLGRNGSRFAPKSFVNHFRKLNSNTYFNEQSFYEIEVADEKIEKADFDLAQKEESQKILRILNSAKTNSTMIHLGGGHDHIYPLLSAIGQKSSSIVVLNIDAHTDTRIDSLSNSGTPFRQFADEYEGDFSLFQIGIQEFANSQTTLSPLKKGKKDILYLNEMQDKSRYENFFFQLKNVMKPDTHFIFSIDVDALDGSLAPGVSAVNGTGLNLKELQQIYSDCLHFVKEKMYFGIYEINPVYDSLSIKTVRSITNWLFEALQK